ncbi:hypothetical protein THIX_30559 [Thiomonas sp. X19]|uniref:hypothetical protein n=1 Tax=Thiomonas sp. X19 TaxID=1050370 RepID=UPI000B74D44F|nr:hypothetical protein [Thiomonas sp. X19]SCC93331.1 hypothetical protein THIX_30559 [Thiomonas sp. X19]
MTDSANPPGLLQREGAVARIVPDRPEQLNVIDVGMARALLGVCEAVAGAAENPSGKLLKRRLREAFANVYAEGGRVV